jgi:hypothetical protein
MTIEKAQQMFETSPIWYLIKTSLSIFYPFHAYRQKMNGYEALSYEIRSDTDTPNKEDKVMSFSTFLY